MQGTVAGRSEAHSFRPECAGEGEEGEEGEEEEEVEEHLVEQEVVEPLAAHELHAYGKPLLRAGTLEVFAL